VRVALVLTLVIGAVAVVIAASGGGPEDGTAATTRWKPLHPALLERTEVGAARIGRFVYVVGGFSRSGQRTTSAVERYDIDRNRWKRVRPMPVGLNHTAATAYAGDLYVMGGYASKTGLQSPVDTLYRYRPKTNRWSRLPRAPSKRAAHTIGVIGHRLYVAGGARNGKALDTLEVYDFGKRTWSTGPSMRTAREHLTGVATGGFFYVLAGRAVGSGRFKVAERYDPAKSRWEQLPDMKKERGGIASAVVGKRIVVFGGEETAGTIARVELYDPASRKWSRLPDMRTPRHGLGGVARGHRVYAIEGGPMPGYHFSRAIEALDVP
jgi:non-specific serine/threonine protein kinase